MREILFRGKRLDNGEWIEGHYGEYALATGEKIPSISVPKKLTLAGSLCYDVDPKTVVQFTGLADKNGKKIFEGDIISDGGFVGIVVFDDKDDGAFLVIDPADPAGEADGEFFSGLIDREVCGNIYDSPELLEVEE